MKTKMKTLASALLIAAVPLIMTSCSTSSNSDQPIAGAVAVDAIQGTATVQSINTDDRTVVLKHPDGSTSTYECGPDVRNFAQIKVGDQVTATVAESVAIVLVKGGMAPAAGTASAMVRAPMGAKPGAREVDTIGVTAKVVSMDLPNRTVTLQTMDGENHTVKVGPDVDLNNINLGDDVGVKLTRAFAISVQSPTSTP
jgi:hypothetical protein